jgi:hypothetical protein
MTRTIVYLAILGTAFFAYVQHNSDVQINFIVFLSTVATSAKEAIPLIEEVKDLFLPFVWDLVRFPT